MAEPDPIQRGDLARGTWDLAAGQQGATGRGKEQLGGAWIGGAVGFLSECLGM